jgi:predicted RNase H-like HicB family nuclease
MVKFNAEQYRYTVFWHEEDNGFIGIVTEFPSLSAFGRTLEKALKEIKFVVQGVLEDMEASNEQIPEPLSLGKQNSEMDLHIP